MQAILLEELYSLFSALSFPSVSRQPSDSWEGPGASPGKGLTAVATVFTGIRTPPGVPWVSWDPARKDQDVGAG